jgi:hypothetical protein
MHNSAEFHVAYKVANAPVLPFPFEHLLVRDVFPADYYRAMREHLPDRDAMSTLKSLGRVKGNYPQTRHVLPLQPDHLAKLDERRRAFWLEVARWMLGGAFADLVLSRFPDVVGAREDLNGASLRTEAMLVQDHTTYALGPHTDRDSKVVSVLFYLPADESRPHLGTSLYIPHDGSFRCPGGPHYVADLFERVYTMPYLPNTLFAFPKSDYCFHGVEPVAEGEGHRDLLLYDIVRDKRAGDGAPNVSDIENPA